MADRFNLRAYPVAAKTEIPYLRRMPVGDVRLAYTDQGVGDARAARSYPG